MNDLISSKSPLTMSSLEVADLTGKRHDNVMTDIRKMLTELHGEGGVLSFQDTHTNPQNGQTYQIFQLPKRETLILVSGYNIQMRARIIDRWQELEAAPAVHLIPQSLPEALRLAADLAEQKNRAESMLAIAAPKAEALDRIATADGSLCIRDAAKSLQVQEKHLKQLLVENAWIYRRPMGAGWLAYSDKLQAGVMEHKVTQGEKGDGGEWLNTQARITAKGIAKLAEMMTTRKAA